MKPPGAVLRQYCAISRGTSTSSMRPRTQPTCPGSSRMSHQSSMGGGGGVAPSFADRGPGLRGSGFSLLARLSSELWRPGPSGKGVQRRAPAQDGYCSGCAQWRLPGRDHWASVPPVSGRRRRFPGLPGNAAPAILRRRRGADPGKAAVAPRTLHRLAVLNRASFVVNRGHLVAQKGLRGGYVRHLFAAGSDRDCSRRAGPHPPAGGEKNSMRKMGGGISRSLNFHEARTRAFHLQITPEDLESPKEIPMARAVCTS